MHIHKIEKHKEFLLQNRKDPITGDFIVENDEVVFCAGCKSVFLLDTWIYLDEKHCEQYETLEKFPSSSVMNFKTDENILFYHSLPSSKNSQQPIPSAAKKTPWVHQKTEISPYQGWFRNPFINTLKVIMWLGGFFLFYVYESPIIIIAFLFSAVLAIIEMIHDWHYGKKVTSNFKKIKNNTFYITNKSIGFSEAYGMNKHTLSVENIDKLVFHEGNGMFKSTYCEIHYKKKGKDEKFKFSLPFTSFEDSISFFNSLKILSASTQIPIQIESKNNKTLSFTQKIINEGYSNFKLERLK